jgi:hypothetical protein
MTSKIAGLSRDSQVNASNPFSGIMLLCGMRDDRTGTVQILGLANEMSRAG